MHLVPPKALKNLNFSGYPLTWVSIPSHQTTKKSQLSRILSHLGIDLVTPKHSKTSTFRDTVTFTNSVRHTKAPNNLNISGYPLISLSISLTQYTQKSKLFRLPLHFGNHLVTPKALQISTFQDTHSHGYAFR